jgi:hypothetical protein
MPERAEIALSSPLESCPRWSYFSALAPRGRNLDELADRETKGRSELAPNRAPAAGRFEQTSARGGVQTSAFSRKGEPER